MRQPASSYSLFLILWAGQLLSRVGSGISAFALGVYLLQKTGSASAYGFLLLCAFLPSVLLAPLGGVIADRTDRKRMIALGDLGSALGMLLVILMLRLLPGQDWPIYLGVALSSVFVALHSPAFKAAVTDILHEQEYAKASGLIQLAEASRYLLAPIVAAFLITRVSLPLVLTIDMLTFVAAALTALLIRKSATPRRDTTWREGVGEDLATGIRYLIGNRSVFRLLCLTSVVTFFTGTLQVLLAPILLSFAGASTLGRVQSIGACGMLLSSLLIGLGSNTADQGKVLGLALLSAGVFYTLIGLSTNAVPITLAAFCFFLTLPFVNTSLEVLFRQSIHPELQGRVWSLISLVSQLGMLVAFAVSGRLADQVFNPLLTDNGTLADSLGRFIGTGAARGSGLLVILCGGLLLLHAVFVATGARRPSVSTDPTALAK